MRKTEILGKGSLVCHVPELLAAEAGGNIDDVNVSAVCRKIGLSNDSVSGWLRGTVTRYDNTTLIAWCHYFGLPLCDVLEYVPPDDDDDEKPVVVDTVLTTATTSVGS